MQLATYKAPALDKPIFRKTRNLLIVDDEPHIINSLKRELLREGYEIFSAPDATAALEEMKIWEIDVVLSDIQMPGMDGISLLDQVRQDHPSIVRLVLTGYGTFEYAEKAINRAQVFGFMTKPWTSEQLRKTVANAFLYHWHIAEMIALNRELGDMNAALKEKTAQLESRVVESGERLMQSIRSGYEKIAGIIDAKVSGSEGHSLRVHDLTLRLCLAAGSPYDDADRTALSSMLHDVGKLAIPDEILKKKGPLTGEECAILCSHTSLGDRFLEGVSLFSVVRDIARCHHENWDGSGYPWGLEAEGIPFVARAVAITNAFDNLACQNGRSSQQALAEMAEKRGIWFEPDLFDVFLRLDLDTKAPFQCFA